MFIPTRLLLFAVLPALVLLSRLHAQVPADPLVWAARGDVGAPGKRTAAAMAFDENQGVTVLFGGTLHPTGLPLLGAPDNQTWCYDGILWRQLTVTGTPPAARNSHQMVYDPVLGRVLMFGGDLGGGVYSAELWSFQFTSASSGTWVKLSDLPSAGRRGANMGYDRLRNRAVVVGGVKQDTAAVVIEGQTVRPATRETWEWNGSTWSQGPDAPQFKNGPYYEYYTMGGPYDGALGWHEAAGLLILVANHNFPSGIPDYIPPAVLSLSVGAPMYQYDGNSWQPVQSAPLPPEILAVSASSYAVAYNIYQDPNPATAFGGSGFVSISHSMAYDSARRRLIHSHQGTHTLEFNGTAWTVRSSKFINGAQPPFNYLPFGIGNFGSLPDRSFFAMAYDSVRGVTVRYGGFGAIAQDEVPGDTWELVANPAATPFAITTNLSATPLQLCTEGSLTLTGAATGEGALRFTWYKDGVAIPGVSGATLTRSSLTVADSGVYFFEVTDLAGQVKRSVSTPVVVHAAPAITVQPVMRRVIPGEAFALWVDYTSTLPATIQWMKNGNPIPGATGKVYVDANGQVADAAAYSAVITNSCHATPSNVVRVEVGPRIVTAPVAPTGQSVGNGSLPPMNVTTDGAGDLIGGYSPPGDATVYPDRAAPNPMQIQWRKAGLTISADSKHVITATALTSSLTILNPDYEDEGAYYVVAQDASGIDYAATSTDTLLILTPLAPPWLTVATGGPGPRSGHGMIYDEARREVVLFGGQAYGAYPRPGQPSYFGLERVNDTWTWNGVAWSRKSPATSPPHREEFALAWDAARQRVVMFGGRANGVFLNDTWEWNGTDWNQVFPTTTPVARSRPAMCYDRVRQETLMLGGDLASGGDYYAERKKLWAFNGTNWVVRDSAFVGDATTIPHYGPAFAFDEKRQVAVLAQSFYLAGAYRVLEWDGTAWRYGSGGGNLFPDPGVNAGAWYDPVRRHLVFTGGSSQPSAAHKAMMFYDGSTWAGEIPAVLDDFTGAALLPLYTRPQAPFETAYDRDRRVLVWMDPPAFVNLGDAFTREMHFSNKPAVASLTAPVVVQAGQVAEIRVLAAGARPITYQWRKNGVVLTDGGNIQGSRSPRLLISRASSADAAAYSVTLGNAFGSLTSVASGLFVTGADLAEPGDVLPGVPFADTPTLRDSNPAVQMVASPGQGTLAMASGALSGLPAAPVAFTWTHNGKPVVAGGRVAIASNATDSTLTLAAPDYDDEGEWELFAETLGNPGSQVFMKGFRVLVPGDLPYVALLEGGPGRRSEAAMAYDSRRKVVVMFGGVAYGRPPGGGAFDTQYNSNETWEWNGQNWVRRFTPQSPPPLDQAGMVFDARRGRMVLHGGRKFASTQFGSAFATSAETWEYDGQTWIQAMPPTQPPARSRPSMCYDSVRQEVLMTGGDAVASTDIYGTRHALWSWNGINWTQRASVLPPRQGGAMTNQMYGMNCFAFDEVRGVAVLFPSFSGSSSDNDVLEWNGFVWRAVTPAPPAGGETLVANSALGTAIYDPYRRMVAVMGAAQFLGEKGVRYWDGARYHSFASTISDDISGRTWQAYESMPRQRNVCAFDRTRRAVVWFDAPNDNSTIQGRRFTREMHFTTAPKILRLPPVHAFAAGDAAAIRVISAGKGPLTHGWSKAAAPLADAGRISGSATALLGITGLVAADAGVYGVSVTNARGVASGSTTLSIGVPIVIQPGTGGVWVAWPPSGSGVLAQSANLADWIVVPGAVSPWFAPALDPRFFYRIQAP